MVGSCRPTRADDATANLWNSGPPEMLPVTWPSKKTKAKRKSKSLEHCIIDKRSEESPRAHQCEQRPHTLNTEKSRSANRQCFEYSAFHSSQFPSGSAQLSSPGETGDDDVDETSCKRPPPATPEPDGAPIEERASPAPTEGSAQLIEETSPAGELTQKTTDAENAKRDVTSHQEEPSTEAGGSDGCERKEEKKALQTDQREVFDAVRSPRNEEQTIQRRRYKRGDEVCVLSHRNLLRVVHESLRRSFELTDRSFLSQQSAKVTSKNCPGSAAVVALLLGDLLICANSGDARCVLSRNGRAVQLSLDHKPVRVVRLWSSQIVYVWADCDVRRTDETRWREYKMPAAT